MPLLLLTLLRPFVMWTMTIIPTLIIANLIAELLKAMVGAVAEHYGIPEDDARIVVANKIIDIAALLGVGTGALVTKIGVKGADYLGIKSISSAKRTLTPEIMAKMSQIDRAPTSKATAGKKMWSYITKIPGTKILMIMMLFQQMGDWYFFKTSLFYDTINAIFGIDAKSVSAENAPPAGFTRPEFDAYAKALVSSGVVGISSQQAQQTQLYSEENLNMLLTWAYGQQLKTGESTGPKAIQAIVEKYYIRKSGSTTSSPVTYTPASGTSTPPAGQQPVKTQIFTGVVKSGVLGAPKQFESVGDGYITSNDDLMETASQTLANFILTLPAKFNYEIAIVSTFKTAGGFPLKGESVRIVTGHNKDGTPRTKLIYKKFAVIHVWLVDLNGRKITILKENMGQVNSTDYTPTPAQLAQVSASITPSIFTSNVENITGLVSHTPVTISSPAQTPAQGSFTPSPIPAPTLAPVGIPRPYTPPPTSPTAIVSTGGGVAQIQNAPTAYPLKTNTGTNNLNVRSTPGTSSTIIDRLPTGTPVRNPESGGIVDGFAWYKVVYDTVGGSKSGYVATQFLIPN